MESILALSLTQNTSDVHLSSGENIILRQNGQLIRTNSDILSAQQLEQKLLRLLTTAQLKQLKNTQQIDFAYDNEQFGRFRVNIFYQKNGISAVLRVIRSNIATLTDIGAPEIFKRLALVKQGLVLVTGATGCGKSTTVAAMLEYINQQYAKHIITLEDPIEFIYRNQQSLIQQREINKHCVSFIAGINAILRQDPDIIMIGELRDRETIEIALQAAETGHTVFATLHTNSAIATINRIIDVFPEHSKHFVRSQLANSLQGIICQKLIMTESKQRKAIFEVLVNIPAVSNLIHEGKIRQLTTVMQTGKDKGMCIMPSE